MVLTKNETPNKISDLWKFIPVNKYFRPTKPLDETVRQGIMDLFRKIKPEKDEDFDIIKRKELTSIPRSKLDKIVTPIDWADATEALDEVLNEWIKTEVLDSDIVFIIFPPFYDSREILTLWADKKDFKVINQPTITEILDTNINWTERLAEIKNKPFLITNLEKFFIRSYKGLNYVREFFNFAWSNPGKYLIGIDSWAWTYLKKSINIEEFARLSLTVNPFDHIRLHYWFDFLTKKSTTRKVLYRETTTGNYVLRPDDESKKKNIFDDNFLKNLAGYSQGIPAIARIIWRNSLRTLPEEELLLKDEEVEQDLKQKQRIVWVLPWEKVDLPLIPEGIRKNELLILHSLLIHNGLSFQNICKIHSFSSGEVTKSLNLLKRVGFIENLDMNWKVSPIAYPKIRDRLNNEDYLVDIL